MRLLLQEPFLPSFFLVPLSLNLSRAASGIPKRVSGIACLAKCITRDMNYRCNDSIATLSTALKFDNVQWGIPCRD